MSWWNRGEELGEHAPAGVEYTDTVPERVIETTSLRARPPASSVPNDPRAGVATVQSPVSFGHAELAGSPWPLNAARSSDAVPPITSCPCPGVMLPITGPVRNCRSLTSAGKPAGCWPVLGLHLPMKS